MYQARARHILSLVTTEEPVEIDEAMWGLFVAIGEFWKLGDDPAPYRLRFRSFMANRVHLNPIYRDFYSLAKRVIARLLAEHGSPRGYEVLFTEKPRTLPVGPPETELEFVQQYVVNEFIGMRLALGSFKAFGAVNY